jgi:hypothetical protein
MAAMHTREYCSETGNSPISRIIVPQGGISLGIMMARSSRIFSYAGNHTKGKGAQVYRSRKWAESENRAVRIIPLPPLTLPYCTEFHCPFSSTLECASPADRIG